MANFRTDTPTCRRIARAFVDFLDSVEPAPGVDPEGLQVAKDCLTEVFRLHQLPESERPEPNQLIKIFSPQGKRNAGCEAKSSHEEDSQTGSSAPNYATGDSSGTSKVHVGEREDNGTVMSKDELFGIFFHALERIHFFQTTLNGYDDHVLLDRATNLFHDAVNEMERSGCKTYDSKSLADALKTLGNKAMQSNLYSDAIERYSCAIALSENAVYYCNRAAAYTQARQYNEAIEDCYKSIEMDPYYSKAYSRLGLAYYAQGNYSDAINKGFKKALELDPNNDAVKENIRVAEQKLNDVQEEIRRYQDGTRPFASVAFDAGTLPPNFASMFTNMAGSASRNQSGQGGPAEDNHGTQFPFASTNFNGDGIPSDIASMFMNMAGGTFQGQGQGQGPQSRSAEQNSESGPSNTNPLPNFASMFMNMAGNGSQHQSSQGQQQGNINFSENPSGGASFTFNSYEEMPEALDSIRSMLENFARGSQGDPRSGGGDRSASR